MSDTTKVNNWSFPFKPKEGNLDSIQHLTAMAKAGGGYYPIGKNGQWHGGIHFDDKTAAVFDQKQVCCIADGEVIAYRVDRNYPTSAYVSSSQSSVSAPFSRCFVLVKHRLQAPDLPARQGVTPVPPPALSFFSLYMHLLDWDSYSKAEAPTAPAFMGETLYSVKPDKAVDSVHGLRVRAAPTNGAVTALLPKGTKVKVAPGAASSKWRELLSIVEGRAIPALTGGESWVYIGEMQAVAGEQDTFLVAEGANDEEPSLAPQKGLNVRKTGNGKGSDPRTGLLPVGAKFSLKAGTTAYRELQQIIEGQEVLPLSTSSVHNIKGFVHFGSLDTTRSEPVLDAVHVLPKPYPIKAGELIGHLGQYQNYNGGSAKPLLHLEVFSCEDVPSFIAKSRAWAASLPDQQKTQLRVYKGASKLIPHREDINEGNPPKTSDTGTTVGVDLLIPQSLLDALPADHKLQVSTTLPGSTTPAVTRWWRLNNLLADSDGNPISGWLAEQEPITTRHSPWEWVGYDFIKETGRPIGKAAYLYDALRRLTDEERANYRAMVSQEDQGPVKARLYDIIDTNRDNKLTTSEIRSALAKPWHAQSIAQLITYYESEWFWKADKWDELDPLMGHIPFVDPNPNWESEKARIEKLSWWDRLKGKDGISADGVAWHFQAVGLLANFCINEKLLVTREQLSEIMLSAPAEIIDRYLLPINRTLELFEINTPLRIAHFLSQVGHETGELKFSEEQSSGAQYEGRASLGNNQAGDGPRFKGRGLLQVTGRDNYTKCEGYFKSMPEYAELDITSSTEKASQLSINPNLAALASGYYWAKLKPKLNDAADSDDLFWVSVYVNGWAVQETPFYPNRPKEPNNMHHRSLMLSRAKKVLGVNL